MKLFRQIKIGTWLDSFFLDLPSGDKLFYLYLLTNPNSSQCGIFEMSSRQIQNETGLEPAQIKEQVQYFCKMGKILYDPATHEFLIVNWMKHNVPINPSVAQCVKRELEQVKSTNLKEVWNHLLTHHGIMPASCDGVSTKILVLNDNYMKHKEEPEPIEEQEKEEEKQQGSVPGCSLGFVNIHEDITSLPTYKKEQEQPTEQNNITHQAIKPVEHATKAGEGVGIYISQSLLGGEPAPRDKTIEAVPPTHSADPPPVKFSPDVEVVIRYFNKAMCTGYRYNNPVTNALIQKQLDLGFTVADCLKVIDKKKRDWGGTKYQCNLTPMVLFGDKFESYLQQSPRTDQTYKHERPPVSVYTNKTLIEV